MGFRQRLRAGLLAAAVLLALVPGAARADEIVVFAAASLRNALDAAAAAWQERTGNMAQISYAGTSALARQLEAGAPADLFFSADLDWMDYAEEHGLIQPDSRRALLGNRIVLVAPADSVTELEIGPGFGLAAALGDGRLAMADTNAVPAGKYGKAALESLGVWESVADRVAQAENVRVALALVARGEAPLGIVYATDAAAEPGVRVLGAFPAGSHPAIVYPVALTAASASPASDFLAFLGSDTAAGAFEDAGFEFLPERAGS